MPLVLAVGPAVEPLTLAEVKAQLRIDTGNQEPAPDAVTAALASPAVAGNVDNGVHRYLATFVTADGETQAGVVSATLTVVDKTVNGQVSLTAIPVGGSAVTSRKIYRTIAAGSTYLLLTTIANNTATTYTDNTADSGLGVGAPTANTTGDPILNRLIKSARWSAENEINRKLVTQQWKLLFDNFPGGRRFPFPLAWGWNEHYGYVPVRYTHIGSTMISLPFPPVQTVDSIKYYDAADVQQTLVEVTDYVVDKVGDQPRIYPAYGKFWPEVSLLRPNAVEILFTVGYGLAAAVPDCVKTWMLATIGTNYDNRESAVHLARGETLLPVPFIDGLLDPVRLVIF